MAGRTNYTAVTNAKIPDFGGDITDVYEHFDPLIGETVATVASLPSTGNWVGRTVFVQDVKDLYVCTATPNTWARVTRSSTASSTATMGSGWTVNLNSLRLQSGWVSWTFNGQRTASISAAGTVATIPSGFRDDAISYWQVLDYSNVTTIPTSSRTLQYDPAANDVKILQSLPANSWLAFTVYWMQVS